MSGPLWLGNAAVHERQRERADEAAVAAEERGDHLAAAVARLDALAFAQARDREQRLEERRAMNQYLNTRRRFGPRRDT